MRTLRGIAGNVKGRGVCFDFFLGWEYVSGYGINSQSGVCPVVPNPCANSCTSSRMCMVGTTLLEGFRLVSNDCLPSGAMKRFVPCCFWFRSGVVAQAPKVGIFCGGVMLLLAATCCHFLLSFFTSSLTSFQAVGSLIFESFTTLVGEHWFRHSENRHLILLAVLQTISKLSWQPLNSQKNDVQHQLSRYGPDSRRSSHDLLHPLHQVAGRNHTNVISTIPRF